MAKNKSFSVQNSITFSNMKELPSQEPENTLEAVKSENNHADNKKDRISTDPESKSDLQETSVSQENTVSMEQESHLNREPESLNNAFQPLNNDSETPDTDSKLLHNEFEGNNTSQEALKEKVKVYMKEPIKKTSITIQRSSLNYLAYSSKIEGLNQPEYLTMLLLEEMDKPATPPDFNTVAEKRSTIGTITKGIQLPESICNWAKKRSALEMKNMSEYMDDLLQSHMKQSIQS